MIDRNDVKRIAVLELWNIGDIVLTMPFLTQLRALFPNAKITLVARPHASEVLASSGLVDAFIETDLTWRRDGGSFNPLTYRWRALARLIRRLRADRFDIAFQCRPHVREYIILALSGARRRVGVSKPGWDRTLTDAISPDPLDMQKKAAWLRLLAPFGGPAEISPPRLEVSDSEREWGDNYLATHGVSPSDVLVAVHPGASIPEKRWPLDRFAEVARDLARRPGISPLVFTDPSGYGAAIARDTGAIPFQVGLRQMIVLLRRCDLLVCNDSGPMHLAGALGVPCVAIFGSGIEHQFAPLGEGHQIVTLDPDDADGSARARSAGPYDVNDIPTISVLSAIDRALRRR